MSSHRTSFHNQTTALTARLGETFGYRFSGNMVELNASFAPLAPGLEKHSWFLQLRAAPTGSAENEQLVAEAPLPPLEELGGTREPFFVSAPACVPAGRGAFQLALVLVSREQGQDERQHDRAGFPSAEVFTGPRLVGTVTQERSGISVRLGVGAIENTRASDNVSGTLSVELWALPTPYTGGAFQGVALAGAALGRLEGQQSWTNLDLSLAFTPPPAGLWHLALMLREWTGAGYVTRDFHAFERPLLVEPNNPVPAVAVVAPAAPASKPKPSATATISVNTAAVAELAKVKGLSQAQAAAIVAGRPYTSLDQLAKIKGFGKKTLAKVRSSLGL